jgi:hypothetical protein
VQTGYMGDELDRRSETSPIFPVAQPVHLRQLAYLVCTTDRRFSA